MINLLKLLLGWSIIIFIVYRRVLVIRLPRDLVLIQENEINYGLCYFLFISIVVCSIILFYNISLLINRTVSPNIFSKMSFKIAEIIDDALGQVYGFVVNYIPDCYDKFSYYCEKFYNKFSPISETFFLFVLYFIRIVILICFLIDVFVYFRLNYMYKSLYLVCFSLIIKMLLYILKDFASNLEKLQDYLIIKNCGIDPLSNLPITKYSFKLESSYDCFDLNYCIKQFIICNKLTGYLDMYTYYASYFNPRFNIIIYSLYLIGWLFIIIINLLLIF